MAGSLSELDPPGLGNRSAYWEISPQLRETSAAHGSRLALRASQGGDDFGAADDTFGRDALYGDALGAESSATRSMTDDVT